MPRGSLVYLLQSQIFLFIFLVITIFEVTSFILPLKCFNCSNSLVSLFFLLRHYVGRDKINRNCVVMNSHHKIIILDNKTILLNLFTHFLFDLVLLHYIASYYTIPFCYFNFKCFSICTHLLEQIKMINLILGQNEKI